MPEVKRRCLVCNQTYTHCNHCKGSDRNKTWRNIYDTEECMKLFDICSAYKNGFMKKGEALIKLKGISLPQHLNDEYQKIVDEILFVEKKPSKRKKKEIEEEVQIEPEQIEEVVNEDLA